MVKLGLGFVAGFVVAGLFVAGLVYCIHANWEED